MDNIKNDDYYAKKALEEIYVIEEYTKHIKAYEQLLSDGLLLDGIMFRLIQLVEYIKNLSIDYKENHYYIPWGDIIGFRNGLVHEYGKTDYPVVYEIITKDIYELKVLFEE